MRGDQVVDAGDGQIKRINAKGEVVRRPTVEDWQELVASEQATDLSGVTNDMGTPQAYVPGARVWSIHHSLPLDRLASEPPIRLAGITLYQTRGWYLIIDNDEAKYRRARFVQELIQAASWTLAPAKWLKDRVARLVGIEAAELALALMDSPDPVVYATLANTYYKAGREVRARGISAMVRRDLGISSFAYASRRSVLLCPPARPCDL
jgi:hypothetical protein